MRQGIVAVTRHSLLIKPPHLYISPTLQSLRQRHTFVTLPRNNISYPLNGWKQHPLHPLYADAERGYSYVYTLPHLLPISSNNRSSRKLRLRGAVTTRSLFPETESDLFLRFRRARFPFTSADSFAALFRESPSTNISISAGEMSSSLLSHCRNISPMPVINKARAATTITPRLSDDVSGFFFIIRMDSLLQDGRRRHP